MTTPPRSPGRGIVLLVLTFLTGLGVGWATYRYLPGATVDAELLHSNQGLTESPPTDTTTEATLEGDPLASLDLDPAQQAAIDSILAAIGAATDSVLEESRGTLAARAESARLGILSVLDAEQAAAFERRLEELGGLQIRRVRRVPVVVDSMTAPDRAGAENPGSADGSDGSGGSGR